MLERLLRELRDDLDQLDAKSLRRRLVPRPAVGRIVHVDGKPLINLAANDYLALSQHPHLKQAVCAAVEQLGAGATASRLVTGHLDAHHQLETRFTAFKHPVSAAPKPETRNQKPGTAFASLLFPTGYMANLAVLTTLAGQGDLIAIDKLTHASLIDAARASGAEVRTYPHLNLPRLERLLQRHQQLETRNSKLETNRPPRRFIVTDSVFSMDGDTADLPALCDLAERCDALLIVDEAHGTGVLGETGAGLCEAQRVADRVPIVISTASKALGSLGGIVTAPEPIIDTLVNRARPFIYTTGAPPAQAAAIAAALDVIRDEPWRRQRLAELSTRLRTALRDQGWPLPETDLPTPIVPLLTGSAERALALANHLRTAGYLAVAIRPPTVAPNTARVRLSLRADLTDDDLAHLITTLAHAPKPLAA